MQSDTGPNPRGKRTNMKALQSIRFEFQPSFLLPLGALLAITFVRFGIAHGVIATALFFACLVAHEAGHAAFAIATGTPVSAFGFCKWGAYIRRRKAVDGYSEILISAAGPLVNLVIAQALRGHGGIVDWLAQLYGN